MRNSKLLVVLGLLSMQLSLACHKTAFKGTVAANTIPPVIPPVTKTEDPVVIPPATTTNPPATTTTITAPPDTIYNNSIEFGANEIFRIGDGFAGSGSACVGQVNTFNLSGTTYYFQFEVLEDDTQIDLSIGRICGIDQIDKDTFGLINEASKEVVLAEKPLPKLAEADQQSKAWSPYAPFKVNKGTYSVIIQSKNIYGHAKVPGQAPDPSKDEYDDFLVGNILLKATKNVKQIKVYAE